eukprot:scaffold65717_cov34-Tisochrysis_lutea.AAC.3
MAVGCWLMRHSSQWKLRTPANLEGTRRCAAQPDLALQLACAAWERGGCGAPTRCPICGRMSGHRASTGQDQSQGSDC